MGRSPIGSDESGLKKGPWTPEEDEKLIDHINKHGHGSWRALPRLSGLNRCGKSCRLRWTNYLRPDIKRGKFSEEEEQTILNLHAVLGNKWSAIATHLPGRTDNEIKNFWNTHLKKKLIRMGFDPMTHRPRTDIFASLPHLIALAKLIENPNWELEQAMRLQTEAVQMARLNGLIQHLLQPSPQMPTLLNSNVIDGANEFNLMDAQLPGDFLQETTQFEHLPDLSMINGASDDRRSLLSKGDEFVVQGCDFGELGSPWQNVETAAVDTSGGEVAAEGCSTSSYGSSEMWSELLLDDHIFGEIV